MVLIAVSLGALAVGALTPPAVQAVELANSATVSGSATGVLTYLEGTTKIQLVWLDRAGKRLGTLGDPGRYYGPIVLSPDDSRVAVQIMAENGQHDIWVVDVARGLASRVTTGPPQSFRPVWSPDGRELIFQGGPDSGDLYRKELRAGATALSLLETDEREYPQDWSRDGKILLYRTTGEENALWALPLGGDGSPELVLKTGSSLSESQMSPDGRRLAFSSRRDGYWNLYLLTPDGEVTQVTDDTAYDGAPAWSPDGGRIAFVSTREGYAEIYILPVAGGEPINISNAPYSSEHGPTWSPDGGRLAFYSDRDGEWDIYVMTSDGADAIKLTGENSIDQVPAWRP
mgnify:CR=1 FL=1